jgi:transcriptional regulator
MGKTRDDLLPGTLDVLILKALSWGARHGYALGRWIRETTGDVLQVEEGALYPALHRLEQRRWLKAEWGITETGRRAKFYALTSLGRKHLRAEIARWERYSEAVSSVLEASRFTAATRMSASRVGSGMR